MLSEVLGLGNVIFILFSYRDVVCISPWFCFAQEHHTKVNANFVKM